MVGVLAGGGITIGVCQFFLDIHVVDICSRIRLLILTLDALPPPHDMVSSLYPINLLLDTYNLFFDG